MSDKSNGDDFHLNSIWQTADGNLIASFRHLSAVLKIDWRTDDGDGRGGIIWKLGGRDSDFTFVDDPYPGGPCAQHTASELPNGHILIFDNGSASMFHSFCIDPADPWGATLDRPFTRVTEYALDVGNGTATLVRQLAPPDRFGFFGGSASRLANGNTLLGWSSSRDAVATEVGPTGEVLWEIKTLPIDPSDENVFFSTYRAAKFAVPDLVAPQVAVAVPAQGATYSLGSTVPSRFTCTDRGGSSLHSCDGTAASRASVDTTTVGAHTFTVTATDGSGNTSVVTRTYTVADRPHLPDAMVRVAGGRGWVGADVHGPAGSQSVTAAIPDPRGSVTVQVRLQNDGTVTDQIAVLGTGSGHAFSVIYRVAGVDVTRRVLAGTYRTPGLEPGERVTLRAIVTRTAAARVGASRRFRVLGRSAADPAVRDAVAWKVTATR